MTCLTLTTKYVSPVPEQPLDLEVKKPVMNLDEKFYYVSKIDDDIYKIINHKKITLQS